MHVAVVLQSSKVSRVDVEFLCRAVDDQAAECAAAWGREVVPVGFYATADDLPPDATHLITIVDALSVPDADGVHDDFGGIIYGEVLATSLEALPHEILEMLVDPTCDGWRPMRDGRSLALEVCDPVEADYYPQTATILGESRTVRLSNYVLPAYFDPAGVPPFDRMGRIQAPFAMSTGGYQIIRGADGTISNIFADETGRATAEAKMARPGSRTVRRHGREAA